MGQISRLPRPDIDRLNDAIDAVIDDPRPKREIAKDLRIEFKSFASDGDDQAERIFDEMADAGFMRALSQRNRMNTGVFVDSITGESLNVPVKASVASRDETGAKVGLEQLAMWTEIPWDQFDAWAQTQFHLASSLTFKNRGLRRILRLRDQFPNSATPGEACRLANIDPNSFDIGRIAA
jgi:hypothetical protein